VRSVGVITSYFMLTSVHHSTTFDWSAFGTGFHFRPALAPLYGSVPLTTGMPIPNPFILTGTEYAYTPRTWGDQRALNAERKKVEKIIRKNAKIKVVTE